jgi:hypothetical protein
MSKTDPEFDELRSKVGVLDALHIIKRERLRTSIQSANTIEDLKVILLNLHPEIPRP